MRNNSGAGRTWYIYILKLEHESWYVGTAKGLRSRLQSHAKKSPYALVKRRADYDYSDEGLTGKRKPTHLHAAFKSFGDCFWVTDIENAITYAMAARYGFDKVRGGGVLLQSWGVKVSDTVVDELRARYANVGIRTTYALEEIDLAAETPYAFPLTKRWRHST